MKAQFALLQFLVQGIQIQSGQVEHDSQALQARLRERPDIAKQLCIEPRFRQVICIAQAMSEITNIKSNQFRIRHRAPKIGTDTRADVTKIANYQNFYLRKTLLDQTLVCPLRGGVGDLAGAMTTPA